MQLFSAGSKSVAKTADFYKNIILTKRKSHALSFVGSLTSILRCSIWNMAVGNEDVRLQFEWQPAQHAAVYTPPFMLILHKAGENKAWLWAQSKAIFTSNYTYAYKIWQCLLFLLEVALCDSMSCQDAMQGVTSSRRK